MTLTTIINIAFLVFNMCWFAPDAHAETPGNTVQALVTLFSTWNGKNTNQDFFEEAAKLIDYPAMCEAAVGKDRWGKISGNDKQQLMGVLRKLIEQRYYPRWHKMFYSGKLNYENEAPLRGDVFVKTILTIGEDQNAVVWRLHQRGGEYLVTSLSVGRKDLVQILHQRFQKVLARRGTAGLIAWMKHRGY